MMDDHEMNCLMQQLLSLGIQLCSISGFDIENHKTFQKSALKKRLPVFIWMSPVLFTFGDKSSMAFIPTLIKCLNSNIGVFYG